MNFRFYIDPTSGLPHIYNHTVNEDEVEQALSNRGEDRPGTKDSRIAIGQTDAGRYFAGDICARSTVRQRVCITAYELEQAVEGVPYANEKEIDGEEKQISCRLE